MDVPSNSFWLLVESAQFSSYRLANALSLACGVWHCLPMAQIAAAKELYDRSQQSNSSISVVLHPPHLLEATAQSETAVAHWHRIVLSNPEQRAFRVDDWLYPTNKEIKVTPSDYTKIQQAIDAQQPAPYFRPTTLERLD
ncbi:MAG: hypothetical protein F6J97_03230 [Leptolyngbya sp. SIO4C1]|nr:hypothetical protein [Leptolyngbya sp. SIO4C1]